MLSGAGRPPKTFWSETGTSQLALNGTLKFSQVGSKTCTPASASVTLDMTRGIEAPEAELRPATDEPR